MARFDRLREFVRHHYFAEAVVAFAFGMVSTWAPGAFYTKMALSFLSAIFLVAAIVSKRSVDRDARAEREALVHAIHKLTREAQQHPLVQVEFEWQQGDPKGKPFTVLNAGDDEARNIRIHSITLGAGQFSFTPVGQLLPNRSTTRPPNPSGHFGLFFNTLIDGLELAIDKRARELKSHVAANLPQLQRLDLLVRAEQKAHDEFANVPVIVTYEQRDGVARTLEYNLSVTSFAGVSRAELQFVREA